METIRSTVLAPLTEVLLLGTDCVLIYLFVSRVPHQPSESTLVQTFSFGVNNIHFLHFHEIFDAWLAAPDTPPQVS